MEEEGKQQEVADGDEEYQAEHRASFMPNAPRSDAAIQLPADRPAVEGVAARCDESEHRSYQAFVAYVHTESERLQEIEYRPDDDAIEKAVSQPVLTLLEGIFSCKKRHA